MSDDDIFGRHPNNEQEMKLNIESRLGVLEVVCAEIVHRLPEPDRSAIEAVLGLMITNMDELNAEEPGQTAMEEVTHRFNLAAREMLASIKEPPSAKIGLRRLPAVPEPSS